MRERKKKGKENNERSINNDCKKGIKYQKERRKKDRKAERKTKRRSTVTLDHV
jgi:hypothetical protein